MSNTTGRNLHFESSTVETIDRSVYNFVSALGLSTTTNKGFKPVPVIWGTAERAYQVKNSKELRDNQGLLVLPIISIKRTSFNKSRQSPGVFQGNIPAVDDAQGGSLGIKRVLYQEKTLKFANAESYRLRNHKNYPSQNPKVVYRTISIPMPVNVEVTYEITLRTEYQQQMNDLMTPFATTPGTVSYVRLAEGEHHYEGFIQEAFSPGDNLSDFSSDERKFETKINLKVIGYLVGEGKNREKPHYAIRENAVEVKIPRERITLGEIPEHEYGAYYGLAGVSGMPFSGSPISPVHFTNVPAASFFSNTGTSGTTDVSGNVVTTSNFGTVMSQFLVIREILKAENEEPADLLTYTTDNTVFLNTEQIYVNGILQSYGATEDYTVSNGNTVNFNAGRVEAGDEVTITYIKG